MTIIWNEKNKSSRSSEKQTDDVMSETIYRWKNPITWMVHCIYA